MKSWLVFLLGVVAGLAALVGVQQFAGGETSVTPSMPTPARAGEMPAVATATPRAPVAGAVVVADSPLPPASPSVDAVAAPAASPAASPAGLMIPVQGKAPSELSDTFTDARSGGRVHDAIDIMAARGTPVVAVQDGDVVKLFTSALGGTTLYQFDGSRTHAYYYAHLDRYAPGIAEGSHLTRGQVLGYVGSTGNASPDAPHLHFAVMVLGPDKRWWQGDAINPYPLLTKQP